MRFHPSHSSHIPFSYFFCFKTQKGVKTKSISSHFSPHLPLLSLSSWFLPFFFFHFLTPKTPLFPSFYLIFSTLNTIFSTFSLIFSTPNTHFSPFSQTPNTHISLFSLISFLFLLHSLLFPHLCVPLS